MFFPVNFLSHCIPCWLDDFIIKIYNAAYRTIFSRFGEFLIFWMTTTVLKTVRSQSVVTRHHGLLTGCPLTPFSWGFFSHPDVIRPVFSFIARSDSVIAMTRVSTDLIWCVWSLLLLSTNLQIWLLCYLPLKSFEYIWKLKITVHTPQNSVS